MDARPNAQRAGQVLLGSPDVGLMVIGRPAPDLALPAILTLNLTLYWANYGGYWRTNRTTPMSVWNTKATPADSGGQPE